MKKYLLFLLSILFAPVVLAQVDEKIPDEWIKERYCGEITETIDKFTGETKYMARISLTTIHKVVKGTSKKIYLSLATIGSTPSKGKGVIILLEGGKKITKEISTDVDVVTLGEYAEYQHSAFIPLASTDIDLLKKYNITDYRLYIFDQEVAPRSADKIRAIMMCLDEK